MPALGIATAGDLEGTFDPGLEASGRATMAMGAMEVIDAGGEQRSDDDLAGTVSDESLGGPRLESAQPERSRVRAVFVNDFRHVVAPHRLLAAELLRGDAQWLCDLVRPLAQRSIPSVESADRGSSGSCRYFARTQQPRRRPDRLTIPMLWEPADPRCRLPSLDSHLELSSVDDRRSRLALSGRYRVSVEAFCPYLDLRVVHGTVEQVIRQFLESVEARLLQLIQLPRRPN